MSQHVGIFRASCRQNRQSDLVIRSRTVDLLTAGTMLVVQRTLVISGSAGDEGFQVDAEVIEGLASGFCVGFAGGGVAMLVVLCDFRLTLQRLQPVFRRKPQRAQHRPRRVASLADCDLRIFPPKDVLFHETGTNGSPSS